MSTALTQAHGVSDGGTAVRVVVRANPYRHLLDDAQFGQLLLRLGFNRATSIEVNHRSSAATAPRGTYGRACLGMVMMDPTVGLWVTNTEAVMAALIIGHGGEDFLTNAAAKAGGHRRIGRNYGEAALVDPQLIGEGGFRHGHSVNVRGVIVGASAQTPDQDLYEATSLATEFVEAIQELCRTWGAGAGPGDWYSAEDRPAAEPQEMVRFAS